MPRTMSQHHFAAALLSLSLSYEREERKKRSFHHLSPPLSLSPFSCRLNPLAEMGKSGEKEGEEKGIRERREREREERYNIDNAMIDGNREREEREREMRIKKGHKNLIPKKFKE